MLAGAEPVDSSVRLSRDPADPGTLHSGADGSHSGRTALSDGTAGPGSVWQLCDPARAGTWSPGG